METRFATVVAALSDTFPLDPPMAWFNTMPEWFTPGMKGTLVTEGPEAGRFAASVASQRQCILSGRERTECWKAPPSPTNYVAAMQGDTPTAEGIVIRTANIGGGVNHAGERASFSVAADHYANSATATLRVCYFDVDGYTVALGAAWPEISDRDVRMVAAMALSGDWRWREELAAYDFAGAQLVNVPGLPLMDRVGPPPAQLQFVPQVLAASLGDPHPAVIGGWQLLEENPMPPEPTLTLTLTATESARLHEMLTRPQAAAATACTCGGHTAAPFPPASPAGDAGAAPVGEPVADAVTRQEFDELRARVEVLEQDDIDDDLANVDGIMAALPAPREPVSV